MKALTFHLDDFGHTALEEFVRREDDSHSSAVRTASIYYLAERDAGRPAWMAPKCMTASADGSNLTVHLDEATWQALHDEAERQDVSAGDLTRHAVLYFLADVDSGRVGHRLESALGDSHDDLK